MIIMTLFYLLENIKMSSSHFRIKVALMGAAIGWAVVALPLMLRVSGACNDDDRPSQKCIADIYNNLGLGLWKDAFADTFFNVANAVGSALGATAADFCFFRRRQYQPSSSHRKFNQRRKLQ